MDDKKRVEAVLFTTGKLMSVEEVAKSAEIEDLKKVKEILDSLTEEYSKRDSALTIQSNEGKYKLNIKKEYGYLANKLVSTAEMDSPTVKTLAIIAYKNPALQSDIIKVRGNKAYDHISLLKEQGLITAEKHGRTRILKLTPQFYEYFDTADQEIKEKFKDIEDKIDEKRQIKEEESQEGASEEPDESQQNI